MIRQFLSTESRKAWVAGVLTALLQPIGSLLAGNGEITLRSIGLSLASGCVSAAMVFLTSNREELGELVDELMTAEPVNPATSAIPVPAPRIAGLPVPAYAPDTVPGKHAAER